MTTPNEEEIQLAEETISSLKLPKHIKNNFAEVLAKYREKFLNEMKPSWRKIIDEDGFEYPPYITIEGKEHAIEERMAMELLGDEVLMLNSRQYICPYSKNREKPETLLMFVICNDVFEWACADAETITMKELPELYDIHVKDRKWGSIKWCCYKRNMKPQKPVENAMKKDGVWCEKMELLPENN